MKKHDRAVGTEPEPLTPDPAEDTAAPSRAANRIVADDLAALRDAIRGPLAALQPLDEIVRSQEALMRSIDSTRAVIRAANVAGAFARRTAYAQQMADVAARLRVPPPPEITFPRIEVPRIPELAVPALDTAIVNAALRNYEGIRSAIANFIAAQPHPAEQVRLMRYLGERGWYPSPEQSVHDDRELLRLADEDDAEAVEQRMVEFARERVSDIPEVVGARWPVRRALVESAIRAHAEGRYELSTPVLLAQADGIALDVLGRKLFSTEGGGKPQTRAKVFALLGADGSTDWSPSFADMFLAPLIHGSSLMANTSMRDARRAEDPAYGGPLNRHGVLHGIDLDYGTEANSLRAALVLDYLAWQAEDIEALTPGADEVDGDETG